jgi:GAF domain-containing protein
VGSGIAGAVAETGRSIRVDDAYSDSRFNPEVDRKSGYRTRTILSLPVTNRSGRVFAVAQLLNRLDGKPFDDKDERKFVEFTESIGVILETLEQLSG